MMILRVKKDVIIYHPTILIIEEGSVLRCDHILFGIFDNSSIMREDTHPDIFSEYFEKIELEEDI